MYEKYIESIKEEKRKDTESLNDTISMHSGSESLFTRLSDPDRMFIEIKDEVIPEIKRETLEEESEEVTHNPRLWERERNHSPKMQTKEEKMSREIEISEEKKRETSEKMDLDTSEDISKLPDLSEEGDKKQSDDVGEKSKLTYKKKKEITLPKETRKIYEKS